MTIHYMGVCHDVKDVICQAPCETKWNLRQPYLVMQGFTNEVELTGDKGIIY
jgi:hypothetical protein